MNFGFEGGNYYFLNDVIIYNDRIFTYKYNYAEIEIKYVHQLQNLYYALTNEELILKKD